MYINMENEADSVNVVTQNERSKVRRKCAFAEDFRRVSGCNWEYASRMPEKRHRTASSSTVHGVPSLIELSEIALQKAFELRCETLQDEFPCELKPFAHLITPVCMNGVMCNVRNRHA